MNLSIIIPNYNGEELLRKNLPIVYEAVNKYRHGSVEIVVADDPSIDNSRKVITDFFAGIKDDRVSGVLVVNDDTKEAGFAKNVNRGVGRSKGDILILMNTDVAPKQDFLDALVEHFEDEKVFAVGCMEESLEGSGKVLRGRGIGKWERGFLIHSRGEVDKSNTLWASGGSSAFSRKIWNKIGGMEKLYNPFYWEDIDLSYRALKAGYKIIFESRSVVVHEHEKGFIRQSFEKSKIKIVAYRNQFIFVWLNITDKDLLISHLWWLPFHFVFAFKRRDWGFYFGFCQALCIIFRVLVKRAGYSRLFTVSDSEVLSGFKI